MGSKAVRFIVPAASADSSQLLSLKYGRLVPDTGKHLLFCPIETKVREMDAKVLLACVAAERGHKVVIGEMGELRDMVQYLPRGVYLSKSIPQKMSKHFRRYKELGYGVAAWCEEGLVFTSREIYARRMVAEQTLALADVFFAWGENQRQAVLLKVPDADDKITKVGNPRLDVLKPPYLDIYREEARELKQVHGNFILFNTNFATGNNVLGPEKAFLSLQKRGKIDNKESETYYWTWYQHRRNIFEQMVELVKAISRKYPERTIIVRPHPSEDHDVWRDLTKEVDSNVRVIFEGTVIPWLLVADVLVHSGCTTAIEAYYTGTPSISYRPSIKEGYEFELPHSVSMQASTTDEVIDLMGSVFEGGKSYQAWKKQFGDRLEAHIGVSDDSLSSERIVSELERFYASSPLRAERNMSRILRLLKDRAKDRFRILRYGSAVQEKRQARRSSRYRRQKMSELKREDIAGLVDKLRKVSGRFHRVDVSNLEGTTRCFVVEASGTEGIGERIIKEGQ